MKNIISLITILFIVQSFFLISCKKDNSISIPIAKDNKIDRSGVETYEGILKFSNMTALKSHIVEIEEILNPNTESENYDKNLELNNFESYYSYTSYRSIVDAWKTNEEGVENPDLLNTSRFGSNVMKSILNDKFEIIIDNEYYNFNYDGYYIFCTIPNLNNISIIRNNISLYPNPIECINKLHDLDILVSLSLESNDISKKIRGGTFFSKTTGLNNNFTEWRIEGDMHVKSGCNNKSVTLSNVSVFDNTNITGIITNGDITVNWGDGSTETLNNQKFILGIPVASTGVPKTFSHVYSSNGLFNITIKFTQLNSNGSITLNVLAVGCVKAPSQSRKLWNYPLVNGNQYAVKREIWMCNTILYHRLGSETDSYKKNSNNKFKNFKCSSITADITSSLAHLNCIPFAGDAQDTDVNDDDAECTKVVGSDYNFNIQNSMHKVTLEGTQFIYNDEFKACP